MLQTRTFLRPGSNVRLSGNVLLNDRDGWSDDIFAQNFLYDVLSLAGVDRSGVFKAVFANTAQSIINPRTPDGSMAQTGIGNRENGNLYGFDLANRAERNHGNWGDYQRHLLQQL